MLVNVEDEYKKYAEFYILCILFILTGARRGRETPA